MKIAVIGCGVMGEAFARSFSQDHSVVLYDRDSSKAERLASQIQGSSHKSMQSTLSEAEVILVAIKPKDLLGFSKTIDPALIKGKLLISILAGTPLSLLRHHFPNAIVVRVMPNLALTCGKGVLGVVEDEEISDQIQSKVQGLFERMGLVVFLPEKNIQALTAVAASGLGFVFAMMEGMIDGGVYLGLTASQTRELVLKTFEGAVALMHHSHKHPAELKARVCSPGGTTIAGLRVMEERGVRSGIMETLIACHEKEMMLKNT